MTINRRDFLRAGLAGAAAASLPRFALAATSLTDSRLVVVLLRGGMDGLHALPRPGDADYARLRGALGESALRGAHAIDAGFALHPALEFAATLYARNELLPIVAVAPPYRERSHFDAQDCLENGTAVPGARSGWLNRAVAELGGDALALTAVMPLILRGNAAATTWSPPLASGLDPILMQRLQTLYAKDPQLGAAFARIDTVTGDSVDEGGGNAGHLADTLTSAAQFMSRANGPRIAFVEDTGWDTHGGQAAVLQRKLGELDAGLRAFHAAGPAVWPRTAVLVVTEFGRTAAVNGTMGTDHGTGGVAFLAGGAVAGGRIAGHWPGLANSQLNQARDLLATTDSRALFKGVLESHFHIPRQALESRVFPESASVVALPGLLRVA